MMYQGKFNKIKKHSCKRIILMVSLLMLLTASVFGTLAFLSAEAAPVPNTFISSKVPNTVVEDITNGVKKNVQIRNDGNTDAYVRAAVVVTWVKEENGVLLTHSQKPVDGTDYEIFWFNEPDFVQSHDQDGHWIADDPAAGENLVTYYYFSKPVAPGGVTDFLFTDCKEKTGAVPPAEGYQLSVEIMGQTVQAKGVTGGVPVVETLWPVDVDADGVLKLK